MIQHIDPKYENGDVCPRCKSDPNFKEDKFFGGGKCCIICKGSGVYYED